MKYHKIYGTYVVTYYYTISQDSMPLQVSLTIKIVDHVEKRDTSLKGNSRSESMKPSYIVNSNIMVINHVEQKNETTVKKVRN
jgi:hypothetical protein